MGAYTNTTSCNKDFNPSSYARVVRASETTVTVTWAFPGMVNFSRFVIEQKDLEGNWRFVAALGNPTARTWTGEPIVMNAAMSLRVVVYGTGGEMMGSGERHLSPSD